MKALTTIKKIPQIIGRKGGRLTLLAKKHSPEVLLVAGIAGGVTAAVMACKATTKMANVVNTHDHNMSVVQHGILDEKELRKAKASICLDTAKETVKIYAPSVGVGVASIACILGSYGIIHKRNVAIAAAYSILNDRFSGYRNRVRDEFGEEKDKELYFGTHKETIEVEVEGNNGKTKKIKQTVNVGDYMALSQYAKCFDETSNYWEPDASYNLLFLTNMQNEANDKLRLNGHLFLNEVYDMLGFPRTSAGCVVGWILDETNPDGDNYVDFGIFNIYNENNRDFVNGYNPSLWLDFNVDGCIQDLI